MAVTRNEHYPAAAAAIESLDEVNQRIVLLRLAAKFNNGNQHFDHSDAIGAYSWLCLACARSGRGPYVVDARAMGISMRSDANTTGQATDG